MTVRGVKFQFEVGEPVLCFEPDVTKARVLYDAKILELTVGRGIDGGRKPEYLVHFQGWNSSWDRVVPESYILASTDENRDLMKLLAKTAKKIKRNKQRKKRIEILLRKHFRDNPGIPEDLSDSSEGESEEDTSDADEDSETENSDSEKKPIDSNEAIEDITFNDQTLVSSMMENDASSSESEEDEPDEPREVNLELPENLRRLLEDDCYYVNHKHKLVQLPASPNVISVLEGYVKNFTANLMYATEEKRHRRERNHKPPKEKNIELVKEVVDGLRLFFDFTLPMILLYKCERSQHEEVINNYIHSSTIAALDKTNSPQETKPELKCVKQEEVHSPRLRSSTNKTSSRHHSQQAQSTSTSPTVKNGGTSLRASRFSPRTGGLKKEPEDTPTSDVDVGTRRVTRNVFAGCNRKRIFSESKSDGENTPSVKEKHTKLERGSMNNNNEDDVLTRRDLRSGRQGFTPEILPSTRTRRSGDLKGGMLSERVIAPPPLNVQGHDSSQDSSASSVHTPTQPGSESSDPSMVYCNGYKTTKEAAMNHIFNWTLVPESVYSTTPVAPSIVYGAHHLLRLFVKLPGLLSQMAIPEQHFKTLIPHLEMFVDYMSERSEELFPDTVYH